MKQHSSKLVVQQVLEALHVLGVEQIVISPGSRNAPFMLELQVDSRFECLSVIDERSAAFFALGLTQQSQKHVAIICTSGTALLNYAPAVAEAYYQRKKLIVISADRPSFWINKGEGQSIVQSNVFKDFTEAVFQLQEDESDNASEWNHLQLTNLINQAHHFPGPFHVNIPFNEPLYQLIPDTKQVEFQIKSNSEKDVDWSWLDDLKGKRIMILIGQHQEPENFSDELKALAQIENIAVFAELHSNAIDHHFISSFDTLIMSLGTKAEEFIRPDVLITLGTNIISRKIKAILRKCRPMHYHIGLYEKTMDTFNCLSAFYSVSPLQVFRMLTESKSENITYGHDLRLAYHRANQLGAEYASNALFSDLKAMHLIADQLPEFCTIHLGNSSIIRYFHLVSHGRINRFESNRGVAGIDGCTSTAVGYSYNSVNEVYFISGDLAFMYDSNAFWNNYVSQKLKIIVINNNGGGIFRIIEGARDTNALEFLQETPHTSSVQSLVLRYNLNYIAATNEDELLTALDVLNKFTQCCVLEVFTPRLKNAEILQSFFKAIQLNHE